MKSTIVLLALVTAACSATRSTETSDSNTSRFESNRLTLTATDRVSAPGILFTRPRVTPSTGKLTVASTRYGSLCRYELFGDVNLTGSTITLVVTFAERLTLCSQEIRALSYEADITAPKGTYDVIVIHQQDAQRDTAQRITVSIP